MIVNPDGQAVGEIAIRENLLIPHSLTLLEKDDLICVADREHSRILCYSAGLTDSEPGKLVFNVAHPRLGPVYAIDHIGDIIFAVTGPGEQNDFQADGLILDLATEAVLGTWNAESKFQDPHDLSVSPDGRSLYVSDISPKASKKVYKFNLSLFA